MKVTVECQDSLYQFWDGLVKGAFRHLNVIEVTFKLSDPKMKISKLRHLEGAFGALGCLPELEELIFKDSDLLVSKIQKMFKKSSIKTLKFHNCTFIAEKMKHMDKVWNGIQQQKQLEGLEILKCSYTATETLVGRDKATYEYEIPQFLQDKELPALRRLVLDECILDLESQEAFANMLSHNDSLEELEIRPVFEASTVERRAQYQVKKQAIHTFLTKTIPSSLSNKVNTTLTKLVISLEDYHLEKVYGEAMVSWIDLVKDDNFTLTDLRASHLPLTEVPAEDDDQLYEYANSYLHHNLKSILLLNKTAAAQQKARQSWPLKEETVEEASETEQSESSLAETAEAAEPPARKESFMRMMSFRRTKSLSPTRNARSEVWSRKKLTRTKSVDVSSRVSSRERSPIRRGGRKPATSAKPLPRTNSLSPKRNQRKTLNRTKSLDESNTQKPVSSVSRRKKITRAKSMDGGARRVNFDGDTSPNNKRSTRGGKKPAPSSLSGSARSVADSSIQRVDATMEAKKAPPSLNKSARSVVDSSVQRVDATTEGNMAPLSLGTDSSVKRLAVPVDNEVWV